MGFTYFQRNSNGIHRFSIRNSMGFVDPIEIPVEFVPDSNIYITYTRELSKISNSSAYLTKRSYASGTRNVDHVDAQGNISLEKSMVTSFTVMQKDSDGNFEINLSHRYTLDDGQREASINTSQLILDYGYNSPENDIKITFDYWNEVVSGLYSTIYSYFDGPYDKIPEFKTSDGRILKLSDSIDLRHSYSSTPMHKLTSVDSVIAYNISLYGSRTDIVSLDKYGSISITKGTAYKTEELIPDSYKPADLFKIIISPYGEKVEYERLNNKKLNHRELLSLDDRLSKLEKDISISELEQDALLSESGSVINGVLTDPFIGHGVVDTTSPLYTSSIDYIENYINVPLKIISTGPKRDEAIFID